MEMPVKKITFIGAGNMASAIFKGMLAQGYPPEAITATAREADHLDNLRQTLQIHVSGDNAVAVADADVIVLAVKPQVMQAVCREIADQVCQTRPLIISVAAGLQAETLNAWLGGGHAVIRCMPNTPSLVGAGASGLYALPGVLPAQREFADQLLSRVGLTEWVEQEALLDVVTAISGSGPAYFFMIFEMMEKAAVELGMPAAEARRLILQTGLGAVRMAQETGEEPAQLKRNVMSPNGTTERAIHTFEQEGMEVMFLKAMQACADRAAEMARELGG
ncbi:Pyrroline-5-carboxylate reductase [Nitrincola lacisaponensis]|uniref:Pyrroline-5-carboxylate reductase n=1 Tax=Nitrincola lacisaponensis TaxID=267850 RepID=A0A063Y5A6_9GAMM|nr:pyrroline-5-carboxylate reductase [Nitrincola lacisaponensis]KDE39712.1 Pyrroline-5-carboxylate reductase [Nitrincola lacisaponensis]